VQVGDLGGEVSTGSTVLEVVVDRVELDARVFTVESGGESLAALFAAHTHWSLGDSGEFPETDRSSGEPRAAEGGQPASLVGNEQNVTMPAPVPDPVTLLARRAGSGDRAAFAQFVSATQADVWRLCAHLVDRQSADDLTQETFERTARGLRTFRAESSGRTFVLSIARRTCADEIRRRTRRRLLSGRLHAQALPSDGYQSDPSGLVDLDALVALLDADRRDAFVLTQLLGLGYAEAAEVCGCPIGTIRSRVSRARADLLDLLGSEARAEEA
jgi:RNA polymerase sigma-70 factor, ECF subfamily